MGKRLLAVLLLLALALCTGAAIRAEGAPGVLLVIDAEARTLALFVDGERAALYPCAVGAPDTPTPLGVFTVSEKHTGWGGGFGAHFLRLSVPWGVYGIHGTNAPASVGLAVSHGCVRLRNADIEALFDKVPLGSRVLIERGPYGPLGSALRTLSPGDTGSDVAEVQARLIRKGYLLGAPDGRFGPYTRAAVRAFRKECGLPDGDAVDAAVYAALGVLLFE